MRTWLQAGLGALAVAAIILLTHFGAARGDIKVESLPGEAQASAPLAAKDAAVPGTAADNRAPAPVTGDAPRIKFENQVHDFGDAMSGEALKTAFTFRNVGKGTLIIERVSGG